MLLLLMMLLLLLLWWWLPKLVLNGAYQPSKVHVTQRFTNLWGVGRSLLPLNRSLITVHHRIILLLLYLHLLEG